uniref:Platelet-derived growth factor (PDGF) family profile domain-containing protein n=1 Tax=Poecilia mexicana TaxID=48701 RepID=A0A3B3WP09_9TELE
MLPQPSPPSQSAFINSCYGVRLQLVTSGGQCSPRGACGATQLQFQQGSVHGHVPSVCFLFLLCLAIVVPVLLFPPQQVGHFHTLLMFQEVWGRSFCRTMEKLVEVVQEYPTEVEHIYSPSCVPLVRCAGCCGDENLECHPTETSNVTMQLLKIRPSEPGEEYVEMTFNKKICFPNL